MDTTVTPEYPTPEIQTFDFLDNFLSGFQMVLSYKNIQQTFFVRFSDHHSESGPFNHRTQLDRLNTRLAWCSDGYCVCFELRKRFSLRCFKRVVLIVL